MGYDERRYDCECRAGCGPFKGKSAQQMFCEANDFCRSEAKKYRKGKIKEWNDSAKARREASHEAEPGGVEVSGHLAGDFGGEGMDWGSAQHNPLG